MVTQRLDKENETSEQIALPEPHSPAAHVKLLDNGKRFCFRYTTMNHFIAQAFLRDAY